MAIEANMQQELPLNSISFYLLVYFGTVLFYTYAYIQDESVQGSNPRTNWYGRNYKTIKITQFIIIVICAGLSINLLIKNFKNLHAISFVQLLPLVVAGFTAIAYYGIPLGLNSKINIRSTGWFKPFAIGFVWAATVTYVPILWHEAEANTVYHFSSFNLWYFIKNFMFISLLAVLFDIKDYTADYNKQLKTFVVQMGLRKTIFYIIIPLALIGFISFLVFAYLLKLHIIRIVFNGIPFILLILVAWSLQRRKSILYYLVVIDGLMLVKALCGIIASLLLK